MSIHESRLKDNMKSLISHPEIENHGCEYCLKMWFNSNMKSEVLSKYKNENFIIIGFLK